MNPNFVNTPIVSLAAGEVVLCTLVAYEKKKTQNLWNQHLLNYLLIETIQCFEFEY